MSLRIHKAMGYAITNTVSVGLRAICDYTKLEKGANLFEWFLGVGKDKVDELCLREHGRELDKFELKEFSQHIRNLLPGHGLGDFYDCIIDLEDDEEAPRAVLFRPYANAPQGREGWFRHDDAIDYAEAKDMETRINYATLAYHSLANGFFPYSGTMVCPENRRRFASGELVAEEFLWDAPHLAVDTRPIKKEGTLPRLSSQAFNLLIGTFSDKYRAEASGLLYEHLIYDWRAIVPQRVLILLAYFDHRGAFPQGLEPVLQHIRPTIATWWS